MCELCEKYGDNGGRWYLNPQNYARPLYKKVEKGGEKEPMILAELQGAINH